MATKLAAVILGLFLFVPVAQVLAQLDSAFVLQEAQSLPQPQRYEHVVEWIRTKDLSFEARLEIWLEEYDNLGSASDFPYLRAKLCLQISQEYQNLRTYDKHSVYDVEALEIAENYGDDSKQWNKVRALVHDNMSFQYYWSYETEKAIESAKKAHSYYVLINDSLNIATILNDIAIRYSEFGDSETAMSYYKQAEPIFEQLNNPPWIIRNKWCQAVDLSILKRHEEARNIIQELLPIMKETKHENYHVAMAKLGELETMLGNPKKAAKLLYEVYDSVKNNKNLNTKAVVLNKLVLLEKSRNNPQKALDFQMTLGDVQDSIYTAMLDKKNLAAKSKFEKLGQEQKIKELEFEKELQASRMRNLIYGVGLLMLFLGGLIYFYNNRQKQKRKQSLLMAGKEMEVQKVREKLLTSITHELRTPLTLIIGQIEALQSENLNEEAKKHAQNALNNSEILVRQITQLLDWNKASSDALTVNNAAGDLGNFVADVVTKLQNGALLKKLNWHVEIPKEKILGEFDFEKVHTVLNNLLTNAIKYTPKQGNIGVKIGKVNDQQVVISITDNGPGIPEDQLPKIFDWYYRVRNKEQDQFEGFGIGLALSKELVELMGGEVLVQSKVNEGSNFSVFLPFVATTETLAEQNGLATTVEGISAEGARENSDVPQLLIVEDHLELSMHLQQMFTTSYQVLIANSVEEASQKALEHIPDLIITDVMLADGSGLDFCETVKSNILTDHIPVLILTARTDDQTKYAGLRNKADAFLTKPFKSEELKLTVKSLMQNRKRMQLKYQQQAMSVTTPISPFVDKMNKVLEEEGLSSSFSVDAFAVGMNISRGQLFKKCKALLGVTPNSIIRDFRLNRAKKLLQTTSQNIAEIAYQSGFSSPDYFSTVYKDRFGCNPSLDRGQKGS